MQLLWEAYGRAMGFVMGLLMIAAGLVWVAVVFQQDHMAAASPEWPTTSGTVEQAELIRGWTRGGERTFAAHVVYRYAVEGREYSSAQITVAPVEAPVSGERGRQQAEA